MPSLRSFKMRAHALLSSVRHLLALVSDLTMWWHLHTRHFYRCLLDTFLIFTLKSHLTRCGFLGGRGSRQFVQLVQYTVRYTVTFIINQCTVRSATHLGVADKLVMLFIVWLCFLFCRRHFCEDPCLSCTVSTYCVVLFE